MQPVFNLFANAQPGLILPNHLFGWLGWLAMAVLLGWGVRHWWEGFEPLRQRWWLAGVLLFAGLVLPMFFGVRLPGQMQPIPGRPQEVLTPALMFFAAIPWVLTAGLFGAVPAAVVGLASGLVLGLLGTNSPFTILEISGLALIFGAAVRQNYRTWFYGFLRHPLGAALVVIVAYIPILILSTLFLTNDTLAVRLDYAFTQIWLVLAARAGELLVASIAAEVVYIMMPAVWGSHRPLVPSPAESNIQARFFYGTVPLVALLVLTLIVGDWLVAGNAARRMIEDRLSNTAHVAADSLPYFLETGQNLILTLASPDLTELPPSQQPDALAKRLRSVPYFHQLFLFDASGNLSAGYPESNFDSISPTDEEKSGILLALKGVTAQVYVAPPVSKEPSAQIAFIASIKDSSDQVQGVLLGRTDLSTNPFTQPMIQALAGMQAIDGQGMVLDEKGEILYHPAPDEVLKTYWGTTPTEDSSFGDQISLKNTREFVYYQRVVGRPWAVVLTVPARIAQQTALEIAIPLLVMLLFLSAVAFVFLRYSLRAVTGSLTTLAQEASFISVGQLDRPLKVEGVDEVGRLSLSFEQMRIALKSRLEELNSLLQVSQGVAANLDIGEAVRPILRAALSEEACAARLVLIPDVTLDTNEHSPVAFGHGPAAQLYATFDAQLFDMVRQQELISLTNVMRSRRLQFAQGAPHPGSLIALAVRHESRYYGVLWVAYDKPRNFAEEEVRFLSTLSGEAALAATSARLYATAEVGRQRLEAVLASTPEPVLVIDEQSRLLLLNPAAIQVPGLVLSSAAGRPVQEVIGQAELLNLLTTPLAERISSREISMNSGKIYYASVSPVVAEGRPGGRVCILRDITHFKELEQLKSDFVATVSHDLRSPLTIMRGSATMLQMVGELNDQQKGYVRKIVSGVENMTRLVNNLLDLGRIEAGIGLQIERVSVNEIAEEVINSLQLQAVQKDIRLMQDWSGIKSLSVEADRALVQQALYNLVENAIKYTPVGGQVRLKLDARPGTVLVEVQDTGIGIAPLDLPHLFEKFYRSGRREAYQQRGTGLGLAIVKSIAERHGGRVWVDSQLGKGSVFSLEVPCEQPQKPNGDR